MIRRTSDYTIEADFELYVGETVRVKKINSCQAERVEITQRGHVVEMIGSRSIRKYGIEPVA